LRPAKFSVWLWQFGQSSWRFSSRVASAVDVVEREAERPPEPFGDPAHLTALHHEPEREEPTLDVIATATTGEQLLDRHGPGPRDDIAPVHRGVPGVARESEPLLALAHRMPLVVMSLHSRPVVPAIEPLVRGSAEVAHVVGDRRLRPTRARDDLGLRKSRSG
jgi:hypothetical protein